MESPACISSEEISLEIELHPFRDHASFTKGHKIIMDGLESNSIVCLLCAKICPLHCDPCDEVSSPLKIKETVAETAFVEMAFLFLNEDRLSFCQSCEVKINQLGKMYANFLQLRNELIAVSTELSHSVIQTNHRLLRRADNSVGSGICDQAYFNEWNSKRIHNMILSNLQEEPIIGISMDITCSRGGGGTTCDLSTCPLMHDNSSGLDYSELIESDANENSQVVFQAASTFNRENQNDGDFEDTHESTGASNRMSQQELFGLGSLIGITDCQMTDTDLKCQYCEETFDNDELLQTHLTVHSLDFRSETISDVNSSIGKFTCTLCSEEFARSCDLRTHMRSHKGQGGDSLSCNKCDKKFTSSIALKRHEKVHMRKMEKLLLTCPVCNKTMRQKRSLDAHLLRHHTQDFNSSTVNCDVCQKRFESVLALMNHRHVHRGNFHCDVTSCKKSFKSYSDLRKHEQIHEAEGEVFDCDFCVSNFVNKTSLEEHLTTHVFLQSSLLCDHCGKSFLSKQLLLAHLRLHKSVDFKCEICDKNFYSSSNLKYHQRLHTGERPFQCPDCNQNFVQKASLKLHMRKHSGVQPFTCTLCENSGFSYKLAFRQHLATKHPEVYLEIKKFLCNTCWKNFGQESELLEHEVLHEKHKCKLCNRQFKMLVHLKEHLLRHASLKPHKCIFCEDKSFLRRKTLIDHIKKSHPDEDLEAATDTDNNVTYIVHITS